MFFYQALQKITRKRLQLCDDVWGMSSEGVWPVCTTGKAGRLPMALHSKYVSDQEYGSIEADTNSKCRQRRLTEGRRKGEGDGGELSRHIGDVWARGRRKVVVDGLVVVCLFCEVFGGG